MKKLYKQSWFWLMLITMLLFALLLNYMHSIYHFSFLLSECFWVAVGSIGSLVGVITATHSICKSENVRKQKDTYDAFNSFKGRNFKYESEIEKCPVEDFAKDYDDTKERHKEALEEIDRYLCEVEQLATCVNTGVFDPITIYNMGRSP